MAHLKLLGIVVILFCSFHCRKQGDFARNDDIYDQLHRHDKDENKPWRTEEEMCAEAAEIRAFFTS